MIDRRTLLSHSARVAVLLASAGALPRVALAAYPSSAFDARNLAEVVKALGGGAPVESKDIALSAPDIAENGAVVPVGASTNLPGVKRLMVLVEKNPSVLSAVFEVNELVEANFTTRVKMGQSSPVYAVAMMGDGRVLFAQKDVKVTMGGCGG